MSLLLERVVDWARGEKLTESPVLNPRARFTPAEYKELQKLEKARLREFDAKHAEDYRRVAKEKAAAKAKGMSEALSDRHRVMHAAGMGANLASASAREADEAANTVQTVYKQLKAQGRPPSRSEREEMRKAAYDAAKTNATAADHYAELKDRANAAKYQEQAQMYRKLADSL